MKYNLLSFVIPVYNEEKTLSQILNKVEAVDLGIEKEIILVNDCSTDRTPEILAELEEAGGYQIFHNEENLGKSQTVRNGIMQSTGDLVVIQDADLEYDPQDLKQFVAEFEEGDWDVIYGNRFGLNNKVVYWQNWIGNRGLSLISSLFTGLRAGMWTQDMEVCYKMAKGEIFREVGQTIESTTNFGLEPEMTAKFSKYKKENGEHINWLQLPIHYFPRTKAEGKHMNAFKDGFKALQEIIRFNLFR